MKMRFLLTRGEAMLFAFGAVVGGGLFLLWGWSIHGEWARVAIGTVVAALIFGFSLVVLSRTESLALVLATGASGLVLIPLSAVVAALAVGLYDWASRPDVHAGAKVAVQIAVTIVGGLTFAAFRRWLQCAYGAFEVAAAVGAACVLAHSTSHGAGLFFALLSGGIYLCVSGLDNMHRGATKPPLDPVWVYLKAKFWPQTATAQAERTGVDGE